MKEERSLRGHMLASKILEWLQEDAPYIDATTESLGLSDTCAELIVRAKSSGITSCTTEIAEALRTLGFRVAYVLESGKSFDKNDIIMRIQGKAKDLLLLERTLLDILMYASGIATRVKQMVEQARRVNPKVRVAATRKTVPGFRLCSKLAFKHGGGDTHRWGLSDGLIVKDSHIELLGSLEEAVKKATQNKSFMHKLEVEVTRPEDAVKAALLGADIVMLDNMSPQEVREALRLLEEKGLRSKVIVEASGGITPENIEEYAAIGVDVISTSYPFINPERVDLSAEMRRVNCQEQA